MQKCIGARGRSLRDSFTKWDCSANENLDEKHVDLSQSTDWNGGSLADSIFVAYAEPHSKTEFFCREIIAWRKPLFTLADPANENLLALGARPINLTDFSRERVG